jgi:NADH-quinone oxidoreductase subunit E
VSYPFVKLVVLLLIACVVGFSLGWLLRGRREAAGANAGREPWEHTPLPAAATPIPASSARATPTPVAHPRPAPAAPSGRDDLKRIRGIGPTLERTLNELGIARFDQIAEWNDADIARVNERLRFSGRIERDDWVGQARELR